MRTIGPLFPRQELSIHKLAELQQSRNGNHRRQFVTKGCAGRRVKHPPWNRNLNIVLKPDDQAGLLLVQRPNDLNDLIEEGVVAITDPGPAELMSSVVTLRGSS